jgi:hypothetical protein
MSDFDEWWYSEGTHTTYTACLSPTEIALMAWNEAIRRNAPLIRQDEREIILNLHVVGEGKLLSKAIEVGINMYRNTIRRMGNNAL